MSKKKKPEDVQEEKPDLREEIFKVIEEFKARHKTKFSSILIYQTLKQRGIVKGFDKVVEALLEMQKDGELLHIAGSDYEDGRA